MAEDESKRARTCSLRTRPMKIVVGFAPGVTIPSQPGIVCKFNGEGCRNPKESAGQRGLAPVGKHPCFAPGAGGAVGLELRRRAEPASNLGTERRGVIIVEGALTFDAARVTLAPDTAPRLLGETLDASISATAHFEELGIFGAAPYPRADAVRLAT